jgi:hypothetical protein
MLECCVRIETMTERMFSARAIKVFTQPVPTHFDRPLIRVRFYVAPPRLRGESIYQPTQVSTLVCKYGAAHFSCVQLVIIKGTQVYDTPRARSWICPS